ncbi:MAG: hypothetical protein WC718_04315 [Phycisphaerales bacterium]|jgi:hypothetical protein
MSPFPAVLPGRAFQNTDRKSNLLFSWRASDLQLKTINGVAGTFSRSSAAGRVVQRGLASDVSTSGLRLGDEGGPGKPSWGYFLNSATGLYEPALVLGRAYTNLITSDTLTGWSKGGTPTVTAGRSDPAGGTGAYRVTDDDAGVGELIYATVSYTGDGVKTIVFVVRESVMAPTGWHKLVLRDATLSQNRLLLYITGWVAGSPTVTAAAGTYLGKRYCGNGYWMIFAATTSVTAASTNVLQVYPSSADADACSIDVYRVNAFNDAVPPPFILSASVARTADSLTFPYLAEPQDITVLVKATVADLPNQGTARTFFNLGNGAGATAAIRAYYEAASARLVIAYHNGTSEVTGYWTVATLALTDSITLRFHQAGTGAIDSVGFKINTGAEDTTLDGAFASTLALPGAWASQVIALAGTNATANSAPDEVKVAAGNRTTAWMEESI